MTLRHVFPALTLPILLAVGCGDGSPPAERAAGEEAPASVTILEPAEGAEIEGPAVRVRLDVSGVRIVPAGDTTPATGHHHLYLDHDVTGPAQPVPTIPGQVIHLGDGSAEYVFENVEAGDHRIVAVVADGVHIPLRPWVVDTVRFRVR
jgi:hypothetical protein